MASEKKPEVKLAELRAIVNLIFDHIQTDLKIESIPLEQDMYWEVPDKQRLEMMAPPSDLHIGQLYDDWEFLQPFLKTVTRSIVNVNARCSIASLCWRDNRAVIL